MRCWPRNPHPDDLGVVVHGPALVASAPGVAVAVRCVFAFPTGLAIDLVVRAGGVHAEAAARQSWIHGTEAAITLTAAGTTAIPDGPASGGSSDDHYSLDLEAWVDTVPADRQLTVTAEWPAVGLPTGQVTLTLASVEDVGSKVLHLP